jgi:hypothetical protein
LADPAHGLFVDGGRLTGDVLLVFLPKGGLLDCHWVPWNYLTATEHLDGQVHTLRHLVGNHSVALGLLVLVQVYLDLQLAGHSVSADHSCPLEELGAGLNCDLWRQALHIHVSV